MFGLSQNVTDLAKARDEATILAQRLKLALTAAGAGVFEYDFKLKSLWTSPEFRGLLGDELLASVDTDPMGVYHPDDRRRAIALFSHAGPDSPGPIDVRIVRPEGSSIWVRLYWQTELDAAGESGRGASACSSISTTRSARNWRSKTPAGPLSRRRPRAPTSWPLSVTKSARR